MLSTLDCLKCHMFFTWAYKKDSVPLAALTFVFPFLRGTDICKRKTSHFELNRQKYIATMNVFGVAVGISNAFLLNGSVTHVLAECFRDRKYDKSQDDATRQKKAKRGNGCTATRLSRLVFARSQPWRVYM